MTVVRSKNLISGKQLEIICIFLISEEVCKSLISAIHLNLRLEQGTSASGEQMYVSDDGEYIFLFVTPPHQKWPYQSNLVLQFKDKQIKEVSDLKLSGFYRESRMVGETLHIVTEEWEATEWKGWNFNYSTVLSSFDLEDPKISKKQVKFQPPELSSNLCHQ